MIPTNLFFDTKVINVYTALLTSQPSFPKDVAVFSCYFYTLVCEKANNDILESFINRFEVKWRFFFFFYNGYAID